jgi:CHASE3 domain sensor protein
LASAQNSYRTGDLNGAGNQADHVVLIAEQVTSAAQSAERAALVSGQNSFLEKIALTVIGLIVFILVLFLVWRRFKRHYIEDLSDAKPELEYG